MESDTYYTHVAAQEGMPIIINCEFPEMTLIVITTLEVAYSTTNLLTLPVKSINVFLAPHSP